MNKFYLDKLIKNASIKLVNTFARDYAFLIDVKYFLHQSNSSRGMVDDEGPRSRVRQTSSGRFRTPNFMMAGHEFAAIEQNSDKPIQWGHFARSGHRVVQFKDCASNRFVAVVVDGMITEYGVRKSRSRFIVVEK